MSLQMTDERSAPQAKIIRMANVYKVIRIGLGLFMFVAAGLKIHGLVTDPSAQQSLSFSPRRLLATIEVERRHFGPYTDDKNQTLVVARSTGRDSAAFTRLEDNPVGRTPHGEEIAAGTTCLI
jgi:hypothetical protein